MSFEVSAIIFRKTCGGAIRRLILLTLADRANPDGTAVWASIPTLAREAEVSERTLQTHMRAFVEEGLIVETGKRPCRNGYTTEYAIVLDAIRALPDIERPRGAASAPVKEVQGRKARTGAKSSPVQELHSTGETLSPEPVKEMHPNLSKEPILEPVQEGSLRSPTVAATGDLLGDVPPPNPSAKPKAKNAYTPEFALLWEAWPPRRRARSKKPVAFARWQQAREHWDAETIMGAARRYLSDPETRKEHWRYCRLVEVFLNGGLAAAIEDYAPAKSQPEEEVFIGGRWVKPSTGVGL